MTNMKNDTIVSFLRPSQREFLEHPPTADLTDEDLRAYWREKKSGEHDLSTPQPLVLSLDNTQDAPASVLLRHGADAMLCPVENGTVTLANLLPGTAYTLALANESVSFTTADEPRILLIDGVSNARDIGGFHGHDGKTVKYGMIFRSQELDNITPKGLAFLKASDIRTDLDLRSNSETHATVLPFAKHVHIPVAPYGDIFSAEQAPLWRDVFSLLADAGSYPLVVHCVGGIDRTGTLCILLGLLLGVCEEKLATDYELSGFTFTNFTERSRFSPSYRSLLRGLMQFDSDLHTAVVLFLRSIGITDEQIRSIRHLLLV